jgi:hypothetical protein
MISLDRLACRAYGEHAGRSPRTATSAAEAKHEDHRNALAGRACRRRQCWLWRKRKHAATRKCTKIASEPLNRGFTSERSLRFKYKGDTWCAMARGPCWSASWASRMIRPSHKHSSQSIRTWIYGRFTIVSVAPFCCCTRIGVDPTLVSPAAKSITREPIASSCRDQTDHTGSRAPKSAGSARRSRGVSAFLANAAAPVLFESSTC